MKLYPMMLVVTIGVLFSACIAPVPAAPVVSTTGDQAVVAHGEHEHMTDSSAELGEVDFPVSCTPEAQAKFNHSMALLHSFEYATAIESFNIVSELDSSCAMAHWGVAMSRVEPLWGEPTAQMLADGWAAIEKAMAAGAQTPREQAYIDAIATFYKDSDTLDHHTRALAYEQAMAQLAQEYADDAEAQIFYSLALLATAAPTDKEYTNQRQAIEILEPIFVQQPDHPGVAHYIIHSNDYPALAAEGFDAALRFADIAPAAPHALHMPSHIFTRLGYWQDSIDTNIAAASVAKAQLPEGDPTIGASSALHAMDYMMYAYLQLGQDGAAQALLDEVNTIETVDYEDFGGAYALAAIPARFALERGQWDEAASLTLHPAGVRWDDVPTCASYPWSLPAVWVRRAPVMWKRLARILKSCRACTKRWSQARQPYWAGQVDIQTAANWKPGLRWPKE